MRKNRALGVDLQDLDVVVVDDSKPMQAIIRTILLAARIGRVRVFDNAEDAYRSMLVEAPNLLITDWRMPGTDGLQLVRTLRDPRSGPLVSLPAIMVTAHATRRLVETAIARGIHYVLAKPLSPANVMKRIEAVTHDERGYVLDPNEGIWVLEDKDNILAGQRQRWNDMRARLARIAAENAAANAPSGPAEKSPVRPADEPSEATATPSRPIPAKPAREAAHGPIHSRGMGVPIREPGAASVR